jgi:putative addiction module killer protein
MYDVSQTGLFAKWLAALRNRKEQTVIAARIDRVRAGNFGYCRALGGGLWELKIDFGPGYRLYYTIEDGRLVILLAGGDKLSQRRDIAAARALL